MTDVVVPDGTTPVEAYRYWIYRDGQLMSMIRHEVWTPGETMRAWCHHAGFFHQDGKGCPDERCSCGIYALKSSHLSEYYITETIVGGKVLLWGKIIPGTWGYRAEYAYPAEFHVHPAMKNDENLAKFGVPIVETTHPIVPFGPKTYRPRSSQVALIATAYVLIVNLALLIFSFVR